MRVLTAALAAIGLFAGISAASAQDAAKGKSVFNQCMACHALDHAVVGPALAGVVGRKAGSTSGYSYSPLMKAAGDAGLTWDQANLVTYLQNPTQFLKDYLKGKGSGSSKMSYKLANEDQRKNVAAYLATEKGK